MKIQKNNKIISLLVLVVFLGIGGWVVMANPLKVTDPNDPRFDPMEFRFENYTDDSSLRVALKKVFPVGTDHAYVDEVLIQKGGADLGVSNYPGVKSYIFKTFKHTNHTFLFDKNGKLLNIHPYGKEKIYEENPGFYDLTQSSKKED